MQKPLRAWVFFIFFFGFAQASSAQGLLGGTASSDSSNTSQDSIWQDPGRDKSQADSTEPVRYVKREYNHRQQVIVGSVVMLCIALTLVGMNNYNPRR